MKTITLIAVVFSCEFAFTKSVQVQGYYRKDGTYVQPHIRSSPDSHKWNNYGPSGSGSKNSFEFRDRDKDGQPNYRDHDDNNNGIHDDNE